MKKIRDFKCDTCGHKFEAFVIDVQEMIACVKCGAEAYKKMSAARYFGNTVGKSPSASK